MGRQGVPRSVRRPVNKVVELARLRGDLVRPEECSECGAEGAVVGHHEDYSKPLEVIWLCDGCHHRVHGDVVTAEEGLVKLGDLNRVWEETRGDPMGKWDPRKVLEHQRTNLKRRIRALGGFCPPSVGSERDSDDEIRGKIAELVASRVNFHGKEREAMSDKVHRYRRKLRSRGVVP